MKYITIMITLHLLFSSLTARENFPKRTKMLIEGKKLTQRYVILNNRLEAWVIRKNTLVDNFKKTHEVESDFGYKNHYGKQRHKQRSEKFYASLAQREKEITDELAEVGHKFEMLNIEFLHRYGVHLSRNEMFNGVMPLVKERKKKIFLLRKYLQAQRSWQACLNRIDKFDAKRLDLDRQTKLSDKRYSNLSFKLDTKIEKNYISMLKHEEDSMEALQAYALSYGYSIPDEVAAKLLLKNIKKSR